MSASRASHRPALGSHRLLGEGVGAALMMPDGEIDWWCPDRFDADPLLWSLLDRSGARSRWHGAEIANWDACPAGPTAHTTVRVGGCRVELWDGLIALDRGSALVRLVRSCEGQVGLIHELSAGGWGAEPRSDRTTGDVIATTGLSLVGGSGVRTGPEGIVVDAESEAWRGFAVCTVPYSLTGTVDELVALLRDAETRSRMAMSRIRLPRDHPSRVTDALRVLRALTDQCSGAPVAAPTTSLPEAPGGERSSTTGTAGCATPRSHCRRR